MEALTFIELAKRVLREEKQALSTDEIWKIAVSKGYDKLLRSVGKTPWATIGAQMYLNMRDRKDTQFIRVGNRPARFHLRELLSVAELQKLDQSAQAREAKDEREAEYLEKDLHPFLAYYASLYLRAYSKTIQHSRSVKKEYGEWIHPDMVACYFPLEDWTPEVMEFGSLIGNPAIKLFSFEIKKKLSFGNLRESFFQTVSTSSWANEAYLVAADIATDDEFQAELKRLSNSFGIGVIRLNTEDPDSSEIVFPSRIKENLDWEAMNKLTMNPDFREFLKRVKNDMANKEIIAEKFDVVMDRDDLVKTIKAKRQ